ncbi:hypothetical protein VIGAN_03117400, partial [Vigna angularis var. angularis]
PYMLGSFQEISCTFFQTSQVFCLSDVLQHIFLYSRIISFPCQDSDNIYTEGVYELLVLSRFIIILTHRVINCFRISTSIFVFCFGRFCIYYKQC